MRITSLKFANLLSFGPDPQEMLGLEKFNLLIGKNGSGKSNVFRLLAQLPRNLIFCPVSDINSHNRQLWKAELPREFANERVAEELLCLAEAGQRRESIAVELGDLAIEYQYFPIRHSLEPPNLVQSRRIVFERGKHIEGDFNLLHQHITLIDEMPISFGKMVEAIEPHPIEFSLLNFGFAYVFGIHVSISDGRVVEYYTRNKTGKKTNYFREFSGRHERTIGDLSGIGKRFTDGFGGYRTERWPSGFAHCASIIMQFLIGNERGAQRIVLIEEPERSIEPVKCRRLFRFLIWLTSLGKSENIQKDTKVILDDIGSKWERWLSSSRHAEYFYDKPFKSDVDFESTTDQVFIASHAPHLIQEFSSLPETAAIYEFDLTWQDNGNILEPPKYCPDRALTKVEEKDKSKYETLFSSIRRVQTHVSRILDNLGANASDLLQTNGVIWVEGPSDIIYLTEWMQMYLNENGLPALHKGLDFHFQMFGGALLTKYCLSQESLSQAERNQKLVEMFSFSRNSFVVIDSDSVLKDGAIEDNSNFGDAKSFIRKQLLELKAKGFKVGLWFDEDNTDVYSIEDYLDSKTIDFVGNRKSSKVIYAKKVTDSWNSEKRLDDFRHGLKSKIAKMVEVVRSWSLLD